MRQAFRSCKGLRNERVVRATSSVLEGLETRVHLSAAALPGLFVENQGQFGDAAVRYAYRGSGMNVGLTDTGATYQFYNATGAMQFGATLIGANAATPAAVGAAAGRFNYFLGEQSAWRANVPGYSAVEYAGIYNGIDLYNYAKDGQLKYEFHVAPGASYGQIAVQYDGIEGLSLASDGALLIDLGSQWGVVRDDAPYIYQVVNGARQQVAGKFVLLGDNKYGFEVTGAYDPAKELVIDPTVLWASYVGYTQVDTAAGVGVDKDGSSLVVGKTTSVGWFDESLFNGGRPPKAGTTDGFLTKYSADGMFVWGTYVGWGGNDAATGIAVDPSTGASYVVGTSDGGSAFGTNAGALNDYHGGTEAMVWKVSKNGQVVWSNMVGGARDEQGLGITLAGNSVVITGSTTSTEAVPAGTAPEDTWDEQWIWELGRPTSPKDALPEDDGLPRLSHNYLGGSSDAFAASFKAEDGALYWSGYYGTAGADVGTSAASQDSYVVLGAYSDDGVSTDGMYQIVIAEGQKGRNGGQVFLRSDYYAGAQQGNTRVTAITLDQYGNVNLAGTTNVNRFWQADASISSTTNAFVVELSAGVGKWGVIISGNADISADAIAVQPDGSVIIGGKTTADQNNFKVYKFDRSVTNVSFANARAGGTDGYVMKLGYGGKPLWARYVGGSSNDSVTGVALSGTQTVSVVGATTSTAFSGISLDNTLQGGSDGFLVSFAQTAAAPTLIANLPAITASNSSTMVPYKFTVDYSSPAGIDTESVKTSTVRISQGGVSLGTATYLSQQQVNATTLRVTYQFTPPGGAWQNSDGVYKANLSGGRVLNVDGFAIGQPGDAIPIGSVITDLSAPTVQIQAANIGGATGDQYQFVLAMDGGGSPITAYPDQIAMAGGSSTLIATAGTPVVSGNKMTVVYTVARPAAGWRNGDYTISLPQGAVRDAGNGSAAVSTTISSDLQPPTVTITTPTSLTDARRTFTVTYNGTGSNLKMVPTNLVLTNTKTGATLTAQLDGTLPDTLGGAQTVTYKVIGTGTGTYNVQIDSGTAMDTAGNGNLLTKKSVAVKLLTAGAELESPVPAPSLSPVAVFSMQPLTVAVEANPLLGSAAGLLA